MTTSTPNQSIAASVPSAARSGSFTTVLRDAKGAPLCHVDVLVSPDHRTIDIADVAAPDVLLDFYFGRAGRRVTLRLIDGQVEGRIETRWETTGRRWWLELG
jgi:hypothetical protein